MDHLELIQKRLASQYRNSENLIAYIQSFLEISNEIENTIDDIIELRWLDNATGKQLDIIGEIVGQPRVVIDISQFVFFGFDGATGAGSFGTLSDSSAGARFRALNEPTTGNVILSDPEYRLFIRARIIKNFTDATNQDVTDGVRLVLGVDNVFVRNSGKAEATISVGRLLTGNEKLLLKNAGLIAKPAGVEYIYQDYDEKPFGFSGAGAVYGFGSLSDPDAGGNFASLI